MLLTIPEKLAALAEKADFPLYVAGGAVRDALCGFPYSDFDLAAPAPAEKLAALAAECGFKINGTYKNTGTVNLSDGQYKYEFTSFRKDIYRGGEHAPANVTFTDDIEEDAKRRDFKCNALYYDIKKGGIVDPLGGLEDVRDRTVNTTRDADEVFSEDGLRLMRLARQAAQLGFVPSLETILGAKFNAARIGLISAERIYAELLLLLHADEKYARRYAHYEGLKILEVTEVLNYILPELAAGKGLAQRSDFHDHDVLEHSFRTCKYADGSIRLAALLHDVGKPAAYLQTGRYHGHDVLGEGIAREILQRLKAPKKTTDLVCRLTALHMYDLDGKARESKIRAFAVKNHDVYEPLLLLKQADYSGCKDDLSLCPTIAKWNAVTDKMKKEGVPFTLRELAVRGDELRGIVPAPETAKVLQKLLLFCAQDGRRNQKETLLREAAHIALEIQREEAAHIALEIQREEAAHPAQGQPKEKEEKR